MKNKNKELKSKLRLISTGLLISILVSSFIIEIYNSYYYQNDDKRIPYFVEYGDYVRKLTRLILPDKNQKKETAPDRVSHQNMMTMSRYPTYSEEEVQRIMSEYKKILFLKHDEYMAQGIFDGSIGPEGRCPACEGNLEQHKWHRIEQIRDYIKSYHDSHDERPQTVQEKPNQQKEF